ncbi:seryl-tRNA synthetase [Mactra antiquata]
MRGLRNISCVLKRYQTITWSRLKCEIKQIHCGSVVHSKSISDQWTRPFTLKDPVYDLDYLLDPTNRDCIRENIKHRKGVGDIDHVVDVYKQYTDTDDSIKKEKSWKEFLKSAGEIPNKSHPSSPIGEEHAAKCVEIFGSKRDGSKDGYKLKTALELGERLHQLRVSNTFLTTGHSTYYFMDKLAMLEHALVNYTVDNLLKQGFQLISVPDLLNPTIIESCGFKTTGDVAQVYRLDPSRHPDVCLAGTSEMSLAGYLMNEVMSTKELPKKMAAVSRCYRAETSNVEQSLGIYRVHQFTKVEMFGVGENDTMTEGDTLLHEFINIEKNLFKQLGLHFRILDMPTAELGAPAYRKFDIEAWLPATEMWGELSSASNCTDYQSRRLNIQYMNNNGERRYCTTVNGTACAVPRTILALLETHQNKDGSIEIPEVLQKYMNGLEKITRSQNLPRLSWIKSNKLHV